MKDRSALITKSAREMQRAAKVAAELSLIVRLEPDGTVVFIPPYLDASARKSVANSVEEWRRQRDEGKTRGRP